MLGIGHVGAISVMEEMSMVDEISYYVGSSAGSIVAALMACGATTEFLRKQLYDMDLSSLLDDSFGVVRDIGRLVSKYGWYKGDALRKWMHDALLALTGNGEITLAEAYNHAGRKKKLTIMMFSMRTRTTIGASFLTKPDLPIAEAIRRSASIPVYYQTRRNVASYGEHDADMFVDGGLIDNYPMHVLREDGLSDDEILGIKLITSAELEERYYEEKTGLPAVHAMPKSIVDYLMLLIEILRDQALKSHVRAGDWALTIPVDVGTLSSTNFSITRKEQEWLYQQGVIAAQQYLKIKIET